MRRALRRYREYSLFLEKYSVGEKTAENNNGLNPKKPLSFGKPGAEGLRRKCRNPTHFLTSTPGAMLTKNICLLKTFMLHSHSTRVKISLE